MMDEKLLDLIKRDKEIKEQQAKLNEEINAYIVETTGIKGPATLLDIILAVKAKDVAARILQP